MQSCTGCRGAGTLLRQRGRGARWASARTCGGAAAERAGGRRRERRGSGLRGEGQGPEGGQEGGASKWDSRLARLAEEEGRG